LTRRTSPPNQFAQVVKCVARIKPHAHLAISINKSAHENVRHGKAMPTWPKRRFGALR